MPVMNRDEFMREFARCTENERRIDLPSEILDGRPQFIFAVYEATHARLTASELNKSYIVLAGLLLGKYPKIAFTVQSHDRIRVPFVALEHIASTKGKLTTQEKLIFAFSAFHSVCIEVYDEDTGEIHKGISELDSPSKIMDLMIEDMDNHPERYEFLSPAKKSRRKNSSAPFGTSKDNPVQAVSIQDGYIYLNNLRTLDGQPVKYRRIGSMSGRDGGIIDGYTVAFNGKSIELYIDPYASENSTEAPEGLTLAEDDTDELAELIEAAQNGDGHAQFELGMMYYHGEGVEQDYTEAFKWYHKAAEQGYSGAQTNLGLMYSRGHGVPQSYENAVKWYKLAASKGFAEALHDLAFLYYTGRGVKQNIKEAVNLWYKAAAQGYADSQNNLGYAYRTGTGVGQNYTEALKWYHLAAEKGNAEALGDLGIMYENGQGVTIDMKQAVKFYRLAADKGNQEAAEALSRLGRL